MQSQQCNVQERYGCHTAPQRPLLGPAIQPLDVYGQVHAVIQRGNRKIEDEVFIVKDMTTPLLSLPAICRLQMIPQLHSTDDAEAHFRSTYPDVFTGLGKLKGEHKIKLRDGAAHYVLSASQRVAITLRTKVKEELDRMEKMGFIGRVEEPTEWCAGMVPIVKTSGKIRICVDFTPEGRSYFKKLPFGISSAPEHFQKRISQLIHGVDGVLCHAKGSGRARGTAGQSAMEIQRSWAHSEFINASML